MLFTLCFSFTSSCCNMSNLSVDGLLYNSFSSMPNFRVSPLWDTDSGNFMFKFSKCFLQPSILSYGLFKGHTGVLSHPSPCNTPLFPEPCIHSIRVQENSIIVLFYMKIFVISIETLVASVLIKWCSLQPQRPRLCLVTDHLCTPASPSSVSLQWWASVAQPKHWKTVIGEDPWSTFWNSAVVFCHMVQWYHPLPNFQHDVDGSYTSSN